MDLALGSFRQNFYVVGQSTELARPKERFLQKRPRWIPRSHCFVGRRFSRLSRLYAPISDAVTAAKGISRRAPARGILHSAWIWGLEMLAVTMKGTGCPCFVLIFLSLCQRNFLRDAAPFCPTERCSLSFYSCSFSSSCCLQTTFSESGQMPQ